MKMQDSLFVSIVTKRLITLNIGFVNLVFFGVCFFQGVRQVSAIDSRFLNKGHGGRCYIFKRPSLDIFTKQPIINTREPTTCPFVY